MLNSDFLDISFAVIFALYDNILPSSQGKKDENKTTSNKGSTTSSGYSIKVPPGEKLRLKMLLIRTAVGLLVNVTGFLTVCGTNRTSYRKSGTAIGLFSAILLYNVLYYAVVTFSLMNGFSAKVKEGNWKEYFNRFVTMYRLFDIIFDVLLLLYNFFASRWTYSSTAVAITVLIGVDIFMNCISFGIFMKGVYSNPNREKYTKTATIQETGS